MIACTSTNDWQSRFVSMLPSIRRTAAFQLSGMTPEVKEDALAEVVANCFVAYFRLVELGKESLAYPSALAGFAVRQYRAGRRVGNRARRNDVYTTHCRKKNGHELCHLGAPGEEKEPCTFRRVHFSEGIQEGCVTLELLNNWVG